MWNFVTNIFWFYVLRCWYVCTHTHYINFGDRRENVACNVFRFCEVQKVCLLCTCWNREEIDDEHFVFNNIYNVGLLYHHQGCVPNVDRLWGQMLVRFSLCIEMGIIVSFSWYYEKLLTRMIMQYDKHLLDGCWVSIRVCVFGLG